MGQNLVDTGFQMERAGMSSVTTEPGRKLQHRTGFELTKLTT